MTKTFVLPDTALQQNIAVLGKNGSGKTYAAKGAIVEPLLAAGRRVLIVDPTGAWWGLRTSRDGKGAGFPVLVLGGDHGDLPLPPAGGAAVARLAVEQGVNLVADTSQLTVGERTRWFTEFAGTLYRANKTPLHLILDEAHNFAPQGKVPDPDAGKMLHAASTLASQGRSRGIRLVMITQRPQKLHKDSLTSAETLIAMRVIAPHDRRAVQDWIDGCAGDEGAGDVIDTLAGLPKGEGWVWYPEGNLLTRTKFPPIRTFDSSATPMDGEPVPKPQGAAPIDLTEIRTALAEAVKEAEANDPKLLRAEIARLRAESAKKRIDTVTMNVAPDERALDAAWAQGHASGVATGRAHAIYEFESPINQLHKATSALQSMLAGAQSSVSPEPVARGAAAAFSAMPSLSVSRPAPATTPLVPSGTVSGPLQRVLDAIAELEAMGVPEPERVQVAFLAGYSNLNSKGFSNALGTGRSSGLLDYPSQGRLSLTDTGRTFASTPVVPTTPRELHERLLSLLGGAHGRVLRPLIDAYPRSVAREKLAAESGYSNLNSKGFANAIGRLRSLGFIDYPSPGFVAAQPVLFLQ